jgi:hypothetical protein
MLVIPAPPALLLPVKLVTPPSVLMMVATKALLLPRNSVTPGAPPFLRSVMVALPA